MWTTGSSLTITYCFNIYSNSWGKISIEVNRLWHLFPCPRSTPPLIKLNLTTLGRGPSFLLPVKFCWNPCSGFRKKVKAVEILRILTEARKQKPMITIAHSAICVKTLWRGHDCLPQSPRSGQLWHQWFDLVSAPLLRWYPWQWHTLSLAYPWLDSTEILPLPMCHIPHDWEKLKYRLHVRNIARYCKLFAAF